MNQYDEERSAMLTYKRKLQQIAREDKLMRNAKKVADRQERIRKNETVDSQDLLKDLMEF